ncbi:hypothetical protein, partial [Enterococcus faecium]|uniref:hypothetical protein n=1 Tax=Enterococcus faecium TaxID=1352 RepID=UPI0039EA45FE
RFHKSIIKEKTVDIIHKMDFVYSLKLSSQTAFVYSLRAIQIYSICMALLFIAFMEEFFGS